MATTILNKRVTAILLALVMCLTMVRLPAKAAEADPLMDGYYVLDQQGNITGITEAESNTVNGFTVSKTIRQTGENRFDITLKVVTSQEVTTSDAAIQLVIDTSSSMQYCSEDCGNRSCGRHASRLNAVKDILAGDGGFLDGLTAGNSGKIYVSVVTFGSGARTVCDWVDIKDAQGLAAVKNAIKGLSAPDNATNLHAGLMLARNRLGMSAVANVSAKFTVVLSDGYANCVGSESTSTSSISLSGRSPSSANATDAGTNGAKTMAATLKGMGELYTVGYGVEAAYLQGIFGSNVYAGNGAEAVTAAFANIARSAVNGMNGAGSTVTDPMGEFVIMGDVSGLNNAGVTAEGSTLTWELNVENAVKSVSGNVTTYTYQITYPITLDTNREGFREDTYYPTNGYTYLSVPAGNETITVPFNIPAVSGQLPVFTVSYQYEGEVPAGAPAAPGTESYKKNSTVEVAEAPAVAHYTFTGWTTADAQVQDGSFRMPGKNVVLVGAWIEDDKFPYTLTYQGNGGVLGDQTAAYTDTQSIAAPGTYETSYTMGVDANSFLRENYTFTGWNTAADGTGTAYAPEAALELTKDANALTLFAQWQENPKYDYSVSYEGNFTGAPEAKQDAENITGTYETSHTIGVDANGFVREHYTFTGWNTAADGTGTAYAPGAAVVLTKDGNTVTLYAQWQEHDKYDYSVSYEGNFTGAPEAKQDAENISGTYETSHTIGVDANGFVREHYTFAGWATEPEGQVVYQSGDTIHFTQGGSVTLYARWIEHNKYSYTVIYNGNGGALAGGQLSYGDSQNIAQTYADSARIAVDANGFVRENHTFIGWNTAADGTGTAYTAEEVIALTKDANTVTLYAQWQENPKYDYSVSYEGNFTGAPEAKQDAENISGTYETAYTMGVDANGFARENYTFIGWNTAADGTGTAYTAEEVIALTKDANTVTLYAQWQEHDKYDYSVSYEGNFTGAPEAKQDAENITGTYETSHTIGVDANGFQRTGYTFTGWNTAADGTGTAYTAEEVIALTKDANTVTLYAQWEMIQLVYTVVYEVRVDDGQYAPFTGELPGTAPREGMVPYGSTVAESLTGIPQSLADSHRAYDYTAIEEVTNPDGTVTVTVYYTHITPEPPVEEEPETPPVDPADDEEELVDIPDDDVPLADVPKTGDAMLLYAGMTALSGVGLAGLGLKKKKEDPEA